MRIWRWPRRIVSDSAFGCAGQRCLAVSTAVTVGDASKPFTETISGIAAGLHVGNGLDAGVQMGPVITPASKQRIERPIETGLQGGAKFAARRPRRNNSARRKGNFLKPTLLDGHRLAAIAELRPKSSAPCSLSKQSTLGQAIAMISRNPYGNAASIFTSSGPAARKFRYEVPTGNIGVNIGVAAPMAYFPFSGWKDSFLGVLHGQGRDAIEFYTDKKVVVERWPKEWSRKF